MAIVSAKPTFPLCFGFLELNIGFLLCIIMLMFLTGFLFLLAITLLSDTYLSKVRALFVQEYWEKLLVYREILKILNMWNILSDLVMDLSIRLTVVFLIKFACGSESLDLHRESITSSDLRFWIDFGRLWTSMRHLIGVIASFDCREKKHVQCNSVQGTGQENIYQLSRHLVPSKIIHKFVWF